jgi:hypothetical protein
MAGSTQNPLDRLPIELQHNIHDMVARHHTNFTYASRYVDEKTVWIKAARIMVTIKNAKQPFRTACRLAAVSRKTAQEHQQAIWRLVLNDPALELHFPVVNFDLDHFNILLNVMQACSPHER